MGHRVNYRAEPERALIGNLIVSYMLFSQVYPWTHLGRALGATLVVLL